MGQPDLLDHEPDIMNAQATGSSVAVNILLQKSSGGVLVMDGGVALLRWENGDPLSFDELEEATERYWREWEERHR